MIIETSSVVYMLLLLVFFFLEETFDVPRIGKLLGALVVFAKPTHRIVGRLVAAFIVLLCLRSEPYADVSCSLRSKS
jgi:hypothetical protein